MNFLIKYKKTFLTIVTIIYLLSSSIYLFKNEESNLAVVYVQLKEEAKDSNIESLKLNLLEGNDNLEYENKTGEEIYQDILMIYGDKVLNESSKELIGDFLIVKCRISQAEKIRELSKLNDAVDNAYSLRNGFVDSYNNKLIKDKLIIILICGIVLSCFLRIINWKLEKNKNLDI